MTVEPMPGLDEAAPAGTRVPRHDLDAERCVLGAVMMAADSLDAVAEVLRAADFYRPAHQLVYEVICDLARDGKPYDAVAVNAALADRGLLGKVGGAPYLHTLLESPPAAANATYYAQIVRRCARMRALATTGTYLWQMGMEGDPAEAETYVARAHEALIAHDDQEEDPPTFAEALLRVLDRIETGEDIAGQVPVPYADLVRLVGGFRPGQLITIGARPGVGKSVCAVDIARHAAMAHGLPVLLASVEMSRDEIVERIISAESSVLLDRVRNGGLDDREWQRVAKATNRISQAPLLIDERPHVTVDTLRASLRRMQRRADVPAARLLIVDYLQLLDSTEKAENRQVAVAELSRGLKLIAKEFGIPVVALSQLNRGPEHRADGRPMVSDLRESGAVEQDSDVVILIHREDLNDKESPRAGEGDLIVGKNRNGPTGVATVVFQGHYSRFMDMAHTPEPGRP